jgi:hypothetical protein
MPKDRMGRARRAVRGAPATRKDPMAAPLFEARTVALLPSVRMAEPHIVGRLMAALATVGRFTVVASTGHGLRHRITVRLSRAWHLAR